LYLKEQAKRVFNEMVENSSANILTCIDCKRKFENENALKCHRYREFNKKPEDRCGYVDERKRKKSQEAIEKKENKKMAKMQLSELDPSEVIEKMNAASKTNELLTQITEQMNDMKKQHKSDMDSLSKKHDDLSKKHDEIIRQNEEMKEMVTEFTRNPKLLVLVDKLYPIQSLR
jgi:hypothetical protein